ncbi:hypothetical protein ACFX2A_006847 [Malus domestica]
MKRVRKKQRVWMRTKTRKWRHPRNQNPNPGLTLKKLKPKPKPKRKPISHTPISLSGSCATELIAEAPWPHCPRKMTEVLRMSWSAMSVAALRRTSIANCCPCLLALCLRRRRPWHWHVDLFSLPKFHQAFKFFFLQ